MPLVKGTFLIRKKQYRAVKNTLFVLAERGFQRFYGHSNTKFPSVYIDNSSGGAAFFCIFLSD